MSKSPQKPILGFVSFQIMSNGINIGDNIEVILIDINLEKNNADEAIINICAGNPKFNFSESKDFAFGNEIVIKLGYNSKNEKIFTGKITQKKIIVNKVSSPYIQIICKQKNKEGNLNLKDSKPKEQLNLTYGNDILETELETNILDAKIINGYIKFQGSALARVNDTIKLNGFGNLFSENIENSVCISSVRHNVAEGNWITTVTLGNTKIN